MVHDMYYVLSLCIITPDRSKVICSSVHVHVSVSIVYVKSMVHVYSLTHYSPVNWISLVSHFVTIFRKMDKTI
jgi:hypothetical protein